MIEVSNDDFGTLCVCALRYCQGRQTYMPSLVRDIVRPLLPQMTLKSIKVMLDDCDFQARYDIYGDENIDKPGWLEWKQELQREYFRRKGSE